MNRTQDLVGAANTLRMCVTRHTWFEEGLNVQRTLMMRAGANNVGDGNKTGSTPQKGGGNNLKACTRCCTGKT